MKYTYFDRERKTLLTEKSPFGVSFLYSGIIGKIILSLANKRFVSNIVGSYLDTGFSKRHIKKFIKSNNINMEEYIDDNFESFNSFFARRIEKKYRPYSDDKSVLISPCDSKLLHYKIKENNEFEIKGKMYTLKELLKDKYIQDEYKNGDLLVFRLTPADYHRFHHIDNGKIIFTKKINGLFHTVGPVAFKKYKVFKENQREYNIIDYDNFGNVIYMEVGAMMVGKIVNNGKSIFKRMDEKGYFKFGGSTVILIFKENVVDIDSDIIENSRNGIETKVKVGESIGRCKYET